MTPLDRLRLLARMFSRPVLEGLARNGKPDVVAESFRKLNVYRESRIQTIAEIFDICFIELAQKYRCEYVYKSAIANRIVYGRHSPRTSSLAVELPVENSIVDTAVFNGTSTAYEIKTEFDNPARLTTQTLSYLRAFDKVNVVTHPKNGNRYLNSIDPRVGIIVLNSDESLTTLRNPIGDTSRIEPDIVFRMLRRDEYISAAKKYFGDQPDLPNGLIASHYRKIFQQLTSHQAHHILVDSMRSRTTDSSTVNFLSRLPTSLRVLGFSTSLSSPQKARLIQSLSAEFSFF